jgi:hypothetical protein
VVRAVEREKIIPAPNSIAISGSTGGAGIGSTDSSANISY